MAASILKCSCSHPCRPRLLRLIFCFNSFKIINSHSFFGCLPYINHCYFMSIFKGFTFLIVCACQAGLCFCFLLGLNNKNFVNLVKEGEIPKEIYENRPKRYNHLNFFSFSDIFQIYCSASQAKVLSCARPMSHLGPDAINHQ